MTKKKVRLTSQGLYTLYPDYKVNWDDVYLKFKIKRTTVYLAPCLCSYGNLLHDIEVRKKVAKECSECDEKWYENEVKSLETIRDNLNTGTKHAVNATPKNRFKPGEEFVFADIYTRAETIDKNEAENMLSFYLNMLDCKNVKYSWKRPDFVIHSL